MYPYVEQLVGYRASDPDRKIGGLVLEVKGDFCGHVRQLLERYGRGDDYIEVSLTSRYRYNPLHNELDAYALAYGIATLMTNLYGRGKEPFWQQASTNLVKFVILLHQMRRNETQRHRRLEMGEEERALGLRDAPPTGADSRGAGDLLPRRRAVDASVERCGASARREPRRSTSRAGGRVRSCAACTRVWYDWHSDDLHTR